MMQRRRPILSALLVVALFALCLALPGRAESLEENYEKLKVGFALALEKADADCEAKLASLRNNYAGALAKLEAKQQASGDLKGVLAVRAEMASIAEEGEPDKEVKLKPVTELRELYLGSVRKIEAARGTSRREAVDAHRERLKAFVGRFTKAGEIERALAVEAEIKGLDSVAMAEEGGGGAGGGDAIRLVRVPTTRPAALKDPLGQSKWSNNITFPAGRYDFRKSRSFSKHGGGGTLYMVPGGVYNSDDRKGIHVLGGRLVAEGCKFRGMRLKADHSGSMYFIDCEFSESTIREEGTWYGYGNYDAPFYFENCDIRKRLTSGDINIYYWGLCMSRCTVTDVELPAIKFRGEPASRRKDKWLRVNRCHFRNCRVPLSFLLITNDCLFTNCTFEDDKGSEAEYKSPFTVTYYTQGCTHRIYKRPDVVTLKEISSTKLQTPVGKLARSN